jgi:hypothetical protein
MQPCRVSIFSLFPHAVFLGLLLPLLVVNARGGIDPRRGSGQSTAYSRAKPNARVTMSPCKGRVFGWVSTFRLPLNSQEARTDAEVEVSDGPVSTVHRSPASIAS